MSTSAANANVEIPKSNTTAINEHNAILLTVPSSFLEIFYGLLPLMSFLNGTREITHGQHEKDKCLNKADKYSQNVDR
jgi:hypothetical protein